MFVSSGQSPIVFVSFIRRAPAFWAWGSTLVPECHQSLANRARSVCVCLVVVDNQQHKADDD